MPLTTGGSGGVRQVLQAERGLARGVARAGGEADARIARRERVCWAEAVAADASRQDDRTYDGA